MTSGAPWQEIGEMRASELRDARLQLHHAAQVVASMGASLLPPAADDSHPNLGWMRGSECLVGRRVPDAGSLCAALDLAALRLQLFDERDRSVAEIDLAGSPLGDAYAWLAESVSSLASPELAQRLGATSYELPVHALADGARFSREPAPAFAELARWYANADALLAHSAARMPDTSPVRCWPHHFDLATLATLEHSPDGDAENASTVGIGFSPGDASYEEPYLYVSPWPYPDAAALPTLASGGHWHTDGFTAAILEGSELAKAGDASAQGEAAEAFLLDAERACSSLLGRAG